MWRPEVDVEVSSSITFFILRSVLSLNLGLSLSAQVPGQQARRLTISALQHWFYRCYCHTWLFCEFGGLTTSSSPWAAQTTLPTEPSPWPQRQIRDRLSEMRRGLRPSSKCPFLLELRSRMAQELVWGLQSGRHEGRCLVRYDALSRCLSKPELDQDSQGLPLRTHTTVIR